MFALNVWWLFASGAVFAVVPMATRAMSIANQDLERYFRATTNLSQTVPAVSMTEERLMDTYRYAFIEYKYVENEVPVLVSLGDDQARYGEGLVKNVQGKLVHVTDVSNLDDDMACSSNIAGTGGEPLPQYGGWIALVRRSHCTFEEKVRNVYEKGAIGVIIYNDRDVTSLEKMQIKGKNRDITAVITYYNVGADLVAILNSGKNVTASISQGRTGARPVNTLNRTSVLFVSVSFIVLMLISLVWLIFYYIQRFRYLQTKDQQSRQLCSVTKKAIMKIPTKTGKMSDEKDGDGDCCAVCIEAYKPTDCIRVLPCKHEFHKNCIDPWLIEHRTCPMCKLDVLKFYGYVFLGSEESILEYDTRRQAALPPIQPAAATTGGTPPTQPQPRVSALADLIRSRDFVLDFPRIFILAPEAMTAPFPDRLPERSQSSMSLAAAGAKEWMMQVTNKLDDQQQGGVRRWRKASQAPDDTQENLLSLGAATSLKRRRSRSADARYTGEMVPAPSGGVGTLSRLTQASYAQSSQRQREPDCWGAGAARRPSRLDNESGPRDVNITIQINGEGFELQ